MLIGGWSNTISVVPPRAETRNRSDTARLHAEQVPYRAFERHAFARSRATGAHHVDRDQCGQQSRDRIGDRDASEPRRVVARRPTTATLRADPVARPLLVLERGET